MPCPQSRWEDMGIQNFTDDKTNHSERTKAAVARAIGMAMICVSQATVPKMVATIRLAQNRVLEVSRRYESAFKSYHR